MLGCLYQLTPESWMLSCVQKSHKNQKNHPFSFAPLPALQPMSQSSIFSCLNVQFEDAHPGTFEAFILIPYFFETLFQVPFFPYLCNHSVPSSISSHIYVFQHRFPAVSSWHCSKLFRNNGSLDLRLEHISMYVIKNLSITS